MEKISSLTPIEAFTDFWKWLKKQPEWKTLDRKEKQSLYKSKDAALHARPRQMRTETMRAIFTKYAPGRYEWTEGFIIHDQK